MLKKILVVLCVIQISVCYGMDRQLTRARSTSFNGKNSLTTSIESFTSSRSQIGSHIQYITNLQRLANESNNSRFSSLLAPILIAKNGARIKSIFYKESDKELDDYKIALIDGINQTYITLGKETTIEESSQTTKTTIFQEIDFTLIEKPIKEKIEKEHQQILEQKQKEHNKILQEKEESTRQETLKNLPFWYHHPKIAFGFVACSTGLSGGLFCYHGPQMVNFFIEKIWGKKT